ncbi:hypothetical protein E1180_16875 [Roseibium denhamense]|uniref:Porin n=1 Tax=Roseibium denhamense TaxID=76305 RepID=A0ABY1P7K6_9HYPH|nr:hypothetical protein [Roseibium denhamense]MTI07180.1 hypothetical protein [Roseibium denhamense]SMP26731.1 hypothetical protein SAMN06265374_2772 [Roseibium denhamense]
MTRSIFLALPMLLAAPAAVSAADLGPNSPMLYKTGALRGSIAVRTWYSRSTTDLNTDDSFGPFTGADFLSTDDISSYTSELVFELEDTSTSAFFRGLVGLGTNIGGDANVFGAEADRMEDTVLGYVIVDGGWQLAATADNAARVNAFLGYHFLSDDAETQTGTSDSKWSRNWHAIRLGVGAEGAISDRIGWSVDVAAVPWAYNQLDFEQNGVSLGDWRNSWTYGFEADAMLNIGVTDNWDIGVGGRYWWLQSNYDLRYIPTSEKVVFDQNYQRYGVLVESKYKF